MTCRYIISDTHFNHWDENEQRGIITFERDHFKNIQEHDEYVSQIIKNIANKIKPGDEFWHLGDFGDLKYLWLIDLINKAGGNTYMILGNHDAIANSAEFEKFFSYVYFYPVYVSNKLVFSHEPVGTWENVLNVHGHLHGSIIDKPNYLNASIHVAGYKPITDKHIAAAFGRMPKWNMRFLYEPFANNYKFTQEKEDVVMDLDGRIDLSASRLLQKINKEKRAANDGYQPYTGGLRK